MNRLMFALQWWRKRELRVIGASVLTLAKSGVIWTLGNTALHCNGSLWMWLNVKELLSIFQVGESGEVCRSDTNKWATIDLFVICDQMNESWWKRTISPRTLHVHINLIEQTLEDKNAERRRKSMGRLSEYLHCSDRHRFQSANHNCGEHRLWIKVQ